MNDSPQPQPRPTAHSAPVDMQLPPPEGKPLNPVENLVLPVLRMWKSILFLAIVGFTGGVLFSLLLPNEYTSNGKVRVLMGKREREATAIDDPEGLGGARGGKAMVLDELYLLRSPDVFERVAELIGPKKILSPYDPAAADDENTNPLLRKMHEFQSWWFRRNAVQLEDDPYTPETYARWIRAASGVLYGRTAIDSDGKSTVIFVNHTSHEPKLSQEITNAFLQAFNEIHLEKHSTQQTLELLRREMDEGLIAAKEAEDTLVRFSKEHGIVDIEAQVSGKVTERQTLEATLKTNRGDLLIAQNELEGVRRSLETIQPKLEVPPEIRYESNPEYTALVQILAQLKAERATLVVEKRYKPDSFEVKSKDELIAEKVKAIEAIDERLEFKVPKDPIDNPEYVRLKSKEQEHSEAIRTLTTRIERSEERLKKVKTLIREFAKHRSKYNELLNDAKRRRMHADSYIERIDDLNIAERLDEAKQSNLQIFQTATLPFGKSGPKRIRFVLAGLGAGLGLGLALAAARGFVDRTIRRPKDLEDGLGVRVLGVVPYSGGWRKAQRIAKRLPKETIYRGRA